MSVKLSDLSYLTKLYPPGSTDNPSYAFAGGSAVQCWLYGSQYDRDHNDIDIFCFNSNFAKTILKLNEYCNAFSIGNFGRDGITIGNNQSHIPIHITQAGYFDSEIIPSISDTRQVMVHKTPFITLSPEFILVSKLSYPNVHRKRDLQDVIALCQNSRIQNAAHLSDLLDQTSLGKIINVKDILNLKTEAELQALHHFIHLQLIKRFLHWEFVNVEVLDPYQFFVLLDIGIDLIELSKRFQKFVNYLLSEVTLNNRIFQLAKLGITFITMKIPYNMYDVLNREEFINLIRQAIPMVERRPTYWISCSKTILLAFEEISSLKEKNQEELNSILTSDILIKIVEQILFKDVSRFSLITSLKAMNHDLLTNCVPIPSVIQELNRILYDL